MGNFPIIVKNLGHEIPSMGKYWEVDVSQDSINMIFLGKRFYFLQHPKTGKIL